MTRRTITLPWQTNVMLYYARFYSHLAKRRMFHSRRCNYMFLDIYTALVMVDPILVQGEVMACQGGWICCPLRLNSVQNVRLLNVIVSLAGQEITP